MFHWMAPLILSIGAAFVAYLYIFPESVLAIFYYGRPLLKGMLLTDRDSLALALSFVVLGFTLLGIWRKYKSFEFKVSLFHIGTFVLIIWALTCSFWAPDTIGAFKRLSIWVFEIMVPMYMAHILVYRGMHMKKLFDQIVIFGIIVLLMSILTKYSGLQIIGTQGGPFDRFSPVSNKVLYSRVMAFLMLFSVWIYDKRMGYNKILIITLGILSLYFLILSATRAPFGIALMLAGIYIVLFYRAKLTTRLFVILVILIATILIFPHSFLFLRMTTIAKGIEASAAYRTIIWKTAFRHFWDVPLYGLGSGGFGQFLPQYLKIFPAPHINLMSFWYETGIFGLIMFIVIMTVIPYKCAKLYFRLRKNREKFASYFYLLEFAFLFWSFGMLNNLINDSFNGGTFEWISLGIMQGVYDALSNQTHEIQKS